MSEESALWRRLDLWLLERFIEESVDEETGGYRFAVEQLPFAQPEASQAIQLYLEAQKPGARRKTLFVIHRVPDTRTRNAIWEAGTRAKHARSVAAQLGSDVKRRVDRAVAPTLTRIGQMNPHAARTTASLAKVIEGAVELLESSAGGWAE